MENKLEYGLIKHMTNNYDEGNILGSGGFGTVYKGTLPNGAMLAVKAFHASFHDNDFQKEFANLKRLKHPNIVELLGFCNDTEEVPAVYNGKQVTAEILHLAICLEYVENGHLGHHIYDESTGIDWHTRYKIIKGVCNGLEYLHKGIDPPILHLDLKPENILIDKDMIPKLADFGLSRLFGEEKTIKTSSNCGTRGYVPPEYIDFQVISDKFDIYSLGVIMVKIITGSERFSKIPEMSRKEFINQVYETWRKRLAIDLTSGLVEVHSQQVRECIKLALDCVKKNSQERPTIQQIISNLIETETVIVRHRGILSKVKLSGLQDNPSSAKVLAQSSRNNQKSKPTTLIELPRYLPFDFLKTITDKFSYKRKLGEVLFGTIYKGILNGGQVIAVTRFKPDSPFALDRSFVNKVHNLFGFNNHSNIVNTIGYCRESRRILALFEGRYLALDIEETLLCYECLAAGSLFDYIYGASRRLDWNMSFNMIIGICRGLHFLHTEADIPIIHGDLKPENIFLDNNMVPKILDFGLSKHYEEILRKKQVDVGSTGYMAPEYLLSGELSTPTDIYSLGVIILEIIARGRNYIIKHQVQKGDFVKNAREIWTYEYIASTYPSLDASSSHHLKMCIDIGLQCVDLDQRKRPTIVQILDNLNTLSMERRYVIHEELVVQSELFEVQPLELCFPLEPKKPIYCSLQLRNRGDDHVAFMLVSKTPERYLTKLPLCGIVPPSCTYTHTITMRAQSKQTSDDSGGYFFTLRRVAVGMFDLQDLYEGSIAEGYADFFNESKEVHEVILPVNCHPPVQEPTRSTLEIVTARNVQQVSSIDVHPTKPWIMTTHKSGHLRVLNYKTMKTLPYLEEDIEESVHVAKFVEREEWLIAGDVNGGIHVYNYEKHKTRPFLLSSSEDADHLIKLWECDNNKIWQCSRTFQGHAGKVMQVTFNSISMGTFTSASMDGTVKIWSIDNDDGDHVTLDEKDGSLLCVDNFERCNRQHLIVGCKNGYAQIWNMEIKGCVTKLEGHADRISAVNLHPELPILITGSFDGTVRFWNAETYKVEDIVNFNLGQVYAFGFIKESRRFVVGCQQGIAIMDLRMRR